jgi:signal transduction histidine kinase
MSARAPSLPLSGRSRTPIYLTLLAMLAIGLPVAATQLRSGSFLPHSFCYLGNGPLTWTHVVSDLLIGISYVAISCTLLHIVRRSEGSIPFHWMVLAFGLFIVACGGTHFMEVVTIWKPYYWVAAAVKIVTAAASVSTAIALPLLSPAILHRMSEAKTAGVRRSQLEVANAELQRLYGELREANRIKDALVAQNAARIGDWSWDIRTGQTTWSEAVELMHGIDPGTHPGRIESARLTVHPDDRERLAAAFDAAMATGDYEVEYRTVRTDASEHWTAARGKVSFGSDGKPERLIGICMDVTGRKANEEALLRAEKLAAAGRLAATVAHEINNPLEAVMNLVFLARTTDEDHRPFLEMAERELARVSAIAKQTLGFYRDTSSPTDVSVAEVVNKVLDNYGGKLGSKNIEVQTTITDDAVLHLRRGDLHQVISNLLANAIDASPVNGEIQVRVQKTGGKQISIEISDQGPGIPPELSKRVFEPFFTTKKDVGTGLGLWVSRRLVEQLDGSLTFDSDASPHSHGTCFRIALPIADNHAESV